ncbi:MAG: class I SAM-dependent methyltransferase [Nostoc sp. ZfuVER08]|uniref:Class I SAM-dependent methyltransferase n=1 Tax=Nostoc punctiforme FACHB-252 TaxID=1357509 RepID=A0ABR8H2E7_NOSPU|nr:methyltransferase domain-containing protein [Nostoc punctiforme]MBD2609704.1 class I SAM-dependent methyltransferase [Nostoc punctiforme FACHB-252]MDZ8012905.1 class I SAM-dependent methyltransferase [Nostoc sp. ZfuVER08]
MEHTTNGYEYTYIDADNEHHHAYLLPPVLELISRTTTNPTQKLRVLDLGCGNGRFSQQIAQAGHEVVGVENSTSGIILARQNIPECNFIEASIYNLPYAELEQGFDIVIAAEVVEHLFYPRELLRAAKKCLKPKGYIILTTPFHGYWKNLAMALLGKMDRHLNPLWDGGHIKFFSVATLTNLLEEEGFTNINFKFAGRVPYFWKSVLCSAALAKN